jgi:MarR family transcriptional regulator, organic hydroperoxide resistance regulator
MAAARTPKAPLTERENQVAARVGELHDVDFNAMAAVSNIYRVASAVRNVMERDILAADGLSWTGFTALYVLWIWGPQESRHLAEECGVTKGTLTGVVHTLVAKGFIHRQAHTADGRLVSLALTPLGIATIRRLFPMFNHGESSVVAGLTASEQVQLASLLRKVLRQAEQL